MIDQIYVSLDLETTGLQPESDEIIEIGAVKFRDGREIEVFQSLVNPRRRIPYLVKSLCSISQEEVDAAPPLSALTQELCDFLEGYPIVGHNISFDIGFLAQKGIGLPNPSYDTFAMSKLMLPHLSQRNLLAVASDLGIPHPSAHRALNDAIVSKEIFTVLLNRLYQLPPSILDELVRLTGKSDWWLGGFLGKVLQERSANFLLGQGDFENVCFGHRILKSTQPLTPKPKRESLDVEELAGFFADDGPLSRTFPQYEQRSEQVQMMRAVAEALNGSQHLIAEAGTGTGKSMAYLLPSAFYACRNNIPVVISTNTINLQEQLVNKDIPDLVQAIRCQPVGSRQSAARGGGLSTIDCLKVVQVKGRTNYLCLRRWDSLRKADGLALEVIQLLAQIQVWLPDTQTGDRSELNLNGRELGFWPRICSQGYDCLGRSCPYHQRGICFLHGARNSATGAHIIVTNHALLLSEIAAGAEILPEYSHLVIDEAHHLESVATDQLGTELRERDIFDHLDQIVHVAQDQRFGFLPQLEYFVRTTDVDPSIKDNLEQLNQSLNIGVSRVQSRIPEFFNGISDLIQGYTESRGEYDLHLRLTSAIRSQPAWSDIEINCENLLLSLENIARILGKIHPAIDDLAIPETLKLETISLLNANEELRHQMNSLVFHPRDNTIHWLTLGRRNSMICLHSAPLHVGLLLQNSLYSEKDSLILTGATLSTEGNFNYLKERLSLEDTEDLLLGSPFDYSQAALIYLATDIPEPGRDGYQSALANALVSLCRAAGGRCLVLFTSHAALRATHAAIRAPLEEEDILVLGQGVDGSPRQILSAFKGNPRTVILGAASFWEGIDVVGEALSVLVIVRLPFSVPSDPIFAARSETFDNPFKEYSLPQTAFKFKQGFGRMIRSKTDRGVMVVLDSRLSTRNYGPVFVNSLPQCQVERGPSRNLPKAIQAWLGEKVDG